MIALKLICFFGILACTLNAEILNSPGRVALWSTSKHEGQKQSNFDTRNLETTQATSIVNSAIGNEELLILLKSTDQNSLLFSDTNLENSFENSHQVNVLNYLYKDENSKSIENSILADKNSQKFNFDEFNSFIKSVKNEKKSITELNNNKLDTIELTLSSSNCQDILNLIDQFNGVSLMLIQEPEVNAMKPVNNGHYQRILSTTTTIADPTVTSNQNTIFYKPEGSEYSIYYADTYLYITPDIFTGIMTSLFIVFVLFTGLSCLNAIQGSSTFIMKPIPIGKEY